MRKYQRRRYTYKSVQQIIANTTNQQLKKKLIARQQEKGICVVVQNNNIQFALKRFRRKLKQSKRLSDCNAKRYYKKPSVSRRQKRNKQKLIQYYKNLEKNQEIQ